MDYQKVALQIVRKKSKTGQVPRWAMRDMDNLVGTVLEAIVDADLRFDMNKSYVSGSDEYKRAVYRSFRADCAIKEYKKQIEKESRKRKKIMDAAIQKLLHEKSIDYYARQQEEESNRDKVKFLMTNSGLTDRQKKVVTSYYMNDATLKKIGDSMNVSKQRVHQIMNKALNKMKTTAGVR